MVVGISRCTQRRLPRWPRIIPTHHIIFRQYRPKQSSSDGIAQPNRLTCSSFSGHSKTRFPTARLFCPRRRAEHRTGNRGAEAVQRGVCGLAVALQRTLCRIARGSSPILRRDASHRLTRRATSSIGAFSGPRNAHSQTVKTRQRNAHNSLTARVSRVRFCPSFAAQNVRFVAGMTNSLHPWPCQKHP